MSERTLNWQRSLPRILFIVFILWFIFTLILNPIFSVIVDSFTQSGTLDFTSVSKILQSDRALKAIRNSFILAVTLTITCNIVGIFIVFATEYFDLKGSRLLSLGYMTVLIFGGLILNNGYLLVYGEDGIVTRFLTSIFTGLDPNWFEGFPAVLFVMTFACTNLHMLFLRNAVRGLDYNIIEAGQNLGSSQGEVLKKIVLPSLKPVLLTMVIMTFQTGLGAMAAPLMVGGREFNTISPLILTFSQRPGSRDLAAVLAILLGLFQIILLVIITVNERLGNYLSVSKTKIVLKKQKINHPVMNILVHLIAYLLFIIYTLPFVMVIIMSFMKSEAIKSGVISFANFTLENYQKILVDAGAYQPFLTSTLFSAFSAIGSVLLMTLVVHFLFKNQHNRFIQWLEYPFFIPWLLPSLLIGLGFILAYSKPSWLLFGESTIGSLWTLPVAYLIVLLPSTLRYIKSAYYSFDQNLEEASLILGASSFRTFFKVLIPCLLPTLLALIAINFNGKLADYDLSAFLYQPNSPTLGIVIRQNADPQANLDAKAINFVYSVILMGINAIVMYLVYGKGNDWLIRAAGRRRGK